MIYLASSSPRRKFLLRQAGIVYQVAKSSYIEENIAGLTAKTLVLRHALGKALGTSIQNGRVLGADTVVVHEGKIIGKPANMKIAVQTLSRLQGRWHIVWTGVAFVELKQGRLIHKVLFAEKTRVKIQPMNPGQIRAYFRRVNPLDKAGAYAIQSKYSIVESIRGSLANATGLPVEKFQRLV